MQNCPQHYSEGEGGICFDNFDLDLGPNYLSHSSMNWYVKF